MIFYITMTHEDILNHFQDTLKADLSIYKVSHCGFSVQVPAPIYDKFKDELPPELAATKKFSQSLNSI